MTVKDEAKKLAAKSKFWKYMTLAVSFVGAALFFVVGMPQQGNEMIEIGKEVAVVEVTDGAVTDVVSATSPVSVTTVSPTE